MSISTTKSNRTTLALAHGVDGDVCVATCARISRQNEKKDTLDWNWS
jgi:hypothetical protein